MRPAYGVGLGVLAASVLWSLPASAQGGGALRRFTEHPTESNRPNRIVYAPLAWAFPGPRPPDRVRDLAVANWYRAPLGVSNLRPDNVLDDNRYTLERFEMIGTGAGEQPRLRVVITQRPASPVGFASPRLLVIHPNQISSEALGTVERLPDGARFTFVVRHPLAGFVANEDLPDTREYGIRLLPAREIPIPVALRRAPTFAGADVETRMATPPPQLPRQERVAGKRLEYRRGRVIEGPRR